MSKRRYTNMQVLLPVIEKMLEAGKRYREIGRELGLEGVTSFLSRHERRPSKPCRPFCVGILLVQGG